MAYQTYQLMIPDAPAPEGPTLALFEAVEIGDLPAAKAALRNGADVNGFDRRLEGRTPLNVAVEFGHSRLAKLLLDHGARLDLGTFSNLAVAFERNDLKMLDILVKRGADPNDLQEDAEDVEWQRDGLNDTPLIRAVREGNRKMVRKLLVLGADPNRLERQGVCALAIAVIRKDRAIRNLLEPVTRN